MLEPNKVFFKFEIQLEIILQNISKTKITPPFARNQMKQYIFFHLIIGVVYLINWITLNSCTTLLCIIITLRIIKYL